jgi:acetyl esterase/lipase
MNRFLSALFLFCCINTLSHAEAPAAPKVTKDIAYVANGHERQKLDVYMPADAGNGKAGPLMVWIHGGAWKEGSKEGCPAVAMVALGWTVASINYRLSQHAIFPAQLEDCKSAIRYLRAHAEEYHIDKARVAVWGASAGGHLVALLGVTGQTKQFDVGGNLDQSSAVSCVIDWFGPTDFLHWGDSSVIKVQSKDDVIAKLFGGTVAEKLELAKAGSPITYASKEAAPILILHGDKDPLVPLQQSQSFHAALEKAGATSKLMVLEGQGHGGPRFEDAAARQAMLEFVTEHTK